MPSGPDTPAGLPFLDRVEIPAEKIGDYLLNPEHPVVRAALLSHAAAGEVRVLPLGRFGRKYVVRDKIRGPNGGSASLLAVWIILDPAVGPRFATAYPEEPR